MTRGNWPSLAPGRHHRNILVVPNEMGNKHSEDAASSSTVEEFITLAKKEGIDIENSILVMFRVS